MECTGHIMSHAPSVRTCACEASSKLHRLSGSYSSGIGCSASQVVSSIGDCASNVTGVSDLIRVEENKSKMVKTYRGSLPIHCAGINWLWALEVALI